MDPQGFKDLWDCPDKCVNGDIVFLPMPPLDGVFAFEGVKVLNEVSDDLYLNGRFECSTGAVVFNFTVKGVGAVCRYCIGNVVHQPAGRFHRHSVVKSDCIRRQLPHVERRDDLRNLSAREAWERVCREAGIFHVGEFFEPEIKCP